MIDVRIQAADFDPGRQLARLGDLKRAGVAGLVAHLEAPDDVTSIFVDHHSALAKTELARIVAEADGGWPLAGIILIHRYGRLEPCDRILFAGAASSDLEAAQQACAFLVAQMREHAPFWRKDLRADGTGDWR